MQNDSRKKLPGNRLNTNCSLKMRISINPVVSIEQRKIHRALLILLAVPELMCTNTYFHSMNSPICEQILPTEINQFTRGQVRGHLALKSAENVFPEGSLVFLWCFVF